MLGALVNIKESDQMDTFFTNKARYLYARKDYQSTLSSYFLDTINPLARVMISYCDSIQIFCNRLIYDLFGINTFVAEILRRRCMNVQIEFLEAKAGPVHMYHFLGGNNW